MEICFLVFFAVRNEFFHNRFKHDMTGENAESTVNLDKFEHRFVWTAIEFIYSGVAPSPHWLTTDLLEIADFVRPMII